MSTTHPNARADFVDAVRAHFDAVADAVLSALVGDEAATLNLCAEETLFVRFNSNQVRQNTNVEQISMALQLQGAGRTAEMSRTLSGRTDADSIAMLALLAQCRAELAVLPADPHQVPVENHGSSDETFRGALLTPEAVVDAVVSPAQGCDMAGLYAAGSIIRANRNSKGQRHWFATQTFFMDYSLYNGSRAVKGSYAGSDWKHDEWTANLAHSKHLLALMDKPLQSVKPGQYRTYLAPRAVADLVGMMGWNALSGSAWKQGRSPFKKLADKESKLSPKLHVTENFGLGLTPRFNGLGEVSEPAVPLIAAGELATLLVSSRTSKEFGLTANGANESEAPRALDVAPGSLEEKDVLQQLGTGLYLSNLHYLNWSDPVSARVTGMTRYACFWVENGEIIGPIKDMRWDESLYDALGDKLLALTTHTAIDPAVDTYFQRALGGSRTPGALIDNFTFTL
jgi:predicted Zn-dependent protease